MTPEEAIKIAKLCYESSPEFYATVIEALEKQIERNCDWCNKGYRFEFNWIDDEGNTVVTKDNMVISGIAKHCPMCGREFEELG